jgi:hypothetical protein
MNFVGFGRGRPRILQSMKVFTSPTVRRLRSSSLLIDIWRDVFDEDHDFHHREGIDSEVLYQPQIIVRVFNFMRRSGSTNRSITPMTRPEHVQDFRSS